MAATFLPIVYLVTLVVMLIGFLLGAGADIGSVWNLMRCGISRFPRRGERLLDSPLLATPYPVRLRIDISGKTLGWDLGIVSFIDGWLVFRGERLEFSIRPSDVFGSPSRAHNGYDLNIVLHEAPGSTVILSPYETFGKRVEQHTGRKYLRRDYLRAAFRHASGMWFAEAPEGDLSVYPPITRPQSARGR